jgi:hypothetical protein
MKIGMVGLDTSHCPAFARILNDPDQEYHVSGGEVVGAYPGGSDQFSNSRNRVQGYTETLQEQYGVTMYSRIPELVAEVDAILLESVDGRQHLEQFQQMAVGKPVFIDKPFVTATDEARQLIQLARDTGTPIMSCSSLRYGAGIADLVGDDERVISCEAFGPAALLDDYPGLFWYGIHSAEILFSHMGVGCKGVRCIAYDDVDLVIGQWDDGRIGVMRGTRFEKGGFGCVVHTSGGARCGLSQREPPGYYLMLKRVMEFFQTRVSPIPIEETFEIASFLEAADKSRAQKGELVVPASL